MNSSRSTGTVQSIAAVVAILFGLATVFAGGRVLMGSDPGYLVFRPLLIYNFVMGFAYMATGATIWRSVPRGRYAAGVIFALNLLVLLAIILLYRGGGSVAVDSLRAMTLRTVVWLLLFLAMVWLVRSRARPGESAL